MSGYALSSAMRCCRGKLLIAAIIFFACATPWSRADEGSAKPTSDTADESAKSNESHVEQLIRDLGNSNYAARRAAANELRQIGPKAFDSLFAATENADPEIAASATYILRQVPVRWIQADDPSIIRPLMKDFSQQTESARLKIVNVLQRLSTGVTTAALCRIARYDRSHLISRTAALAIIRHPDKSANESRPDPDVVEQELGTSTRPAAKWLRQYLSQLRDPAASVAGWRQLIEQESARLEKNSGDTSNDIVLGLSWNLADVYRLVGDRNALHGVLDRMIVFAAAASDDMLLDLLEWLTDNKSWDVLDTYLAKHQSRFEQSKRPLYYAALARAKQGKHDLAEELAAKAAALPAQARYEGIIAAKDMEQHGQFEWAVREYRRTIEKQQPESIDSILARISLPTLLHDYEKDQEAADALEPLFKAVNGEGRLGQAYMQLRQYNVLRDYGMIRDGDDRSGLPSPNVIADRYHFYRALQYQQAKDWKHAREELLAAIKSDPEDADVLISMYRLPESDAKWHADTVERIQKLVQKFQREIDEEPSDPGPYNQWSWLVSNTEGDFQKAIRYSHRSLELNTDGESESASLLDTLGRCYYAAGDYKNAVKYEREAIAKNSHMQVMQRQLALFEKALADQQGTSKSN